MFKVPRVVRLILARKCHRYETKTTIDKTALHNNNERFTLKTALPSSAPAHARVSTGLNMSCTLLELYLQLAAAVRENSPRSRRDVDGPERAAEMEPTIL